MRLVSNSDDNKKYALDKKDYTVLFTLIDMGIYIGHKTREWWMQAPEIWKAMEIDVETNNPDKNIHTEFLVDDHGEMLRTLIKDSKGIKRIRIYNNDSPYNTKNEEEHLRGKGMIKVNGRWTQDVIVVPTEDVSGTGEWFYYDEESRRFVNEEGREAPQTIVSQFELPELLVTAGKQVADRFTCLRNEMKRIPEEIDIDEEINL